MPCSPSPPTVTTKVLFDAANGFQRAAGELGTAASALALAAAASSAYQGIPSLLMTTTRDSGSRELAAQLKDAAAAAISLSKQIQAAPTGTDFTAHRDAILGWARTAADAAYLVEPASLGL